VWSGAFSVRLWAPSEGAGAPLGGAVRAWSAAPLRVPGKALRLRWPGGYQARLRRPGNAVPRRTTHPLTIIDFTGYRPSVAGGHHRLPLCRLRDGARWAAVCSGVGRAGLVSHVVIVALRGAVVVFMSEYGRYGGPRFAQLNDDYKVWAVYCHIQLIKEKVWAVVVMDRLASGSDSIGNMVADAWDIMNESALATIQMSVKPVHLYSVTAVRTAKCDGPAHGPHTRGTRFPRNMSHYHRFQIVPLATHL